MSINHFTNADSFLASATGPIRFNMTNDFMFKTVLQRNNHVLISLICALLHLEESAIQSAVVQNPIEPGERIDDKTVILDVKVLLNNNAILDLEMQVVNKGNWVERSSYYLCRNYANLSSGSGYKLVQPSYQIGFLDYTLFPDYPEFYAVNLFMNKRTHQIYTDKLRISVIDLTQIDLATEEDRLYKIDQWARLFKATTWEELKMLTFPDSVLAEAGETIYKVSADEHMRQLLEAREDAIRQELDVQWAMDHTTKQLNEAVAKLDAATAERDAATAERDAATAKLDAALALLKKHGIDPNEENNSKSQK